MSACIFIPTRNAARKIVGVLEAIPVSLGRQCAEVFVLDNASADGTLDAVHERLVRGFPFPVNVYQNPTNVGYGGSQKVAYAHAVARGYDFVAMLHGDGQYPAGKVPDLLWSLRLAEGAGMAYGSRLLALQERDETPWFRRLGVRTLSALQNWTSGLRLAEWYSGFRAFRVSALRQIPFEACADDYYFDVQIILLLSMAGYAVAELPIAKKYDEHSSNAGICHFGGQVLRRLLHYPLARARLLPSRLYRRKNWPNLARACPPRKALAGTLVCPDPVGYGARAGSQACPGRLPDCG
jgi:glycosyltransferase involved in cell wall biosynthesis